MPKASRQRAIVLEPISDGTAARIAHILGAGSGMAHAIAETARRRAAGEDVHIWKSGATILVGPTPPGDPA